MCVSTIVVCLNGCFWLLAAAGAGDGTVGYIRGEIKATYANNLESIYKASHETVKELELFILEDHADKISSRIVSLNTQDKKIRILLKSVNAETTEIRIRVGKFGDQPLSHMIYDRIKGKI